MVLTVNPAITYGVFERVKNIILLGNTHGKMKPLTAFLVGALSKTLATVVSRYDVLSPTQLTSVQVTYPYIMAKIRIQAGTEEEEVEDDELPVHNGERHKHIHDKGAIEILSEVLNERGFVGWYQVSHFYSAK